jgi:hypothetical protein
MKTICFQWKKKWAKNIIFSKNKESFVRINENVSNISMEMVYARIA